MFKKLGKITGWLVLIVFIIGTFSFTSFERKNIVCRNIEVDYNSNDLIHIDKNEIVRLVKSADAKIIGKPMSQINSEMVEEAVEKHDAIINAEVYKVMAKDTGSYKGIIAVKINHRKPVMRIVTGSENYYLDEFGSKIPVSTYYTANVLAATGNINEEFAKKELLPFVMFLENDEFWKAQIEQVHVNGKGEVLLIPLIGEHIVEMGKLNDYPVKLQKLKAFYEQVLAKNNWNKYETVDLKFNNQVIAKKR